MRANKKMSKREKHPEVVYHVEVDGYPVWIYGRRGRRAYVAIELLKSEYPRSWRVSSVVPMEFTKACRNPEWAGKLCANLVLGYDYFDMEIPGFPVNSTTYAPILGNRTMAATMWQKEGTIMEKCWCCGKLCKEDEMTIVRHLVIGGESFYCPWCSEGMLEVIYMENLDSEIEVSYPVDR